MNEERTCISETRTTSLNDSICLSHPVLTDHSSHMRIFDAGSSQKALLVFSDATSEVSAFLIHQDGSSMNISKENCPKEFQMIKNLDSFNGFLENAHVRGTVLSDGEAKLYVMQRGLGGMWKQGGINMPSTNYTPPSAKPVNNGIVPGVPIGGLVGTTHGFNAGVGLTQASSAMPHNFAIAGQAGASYSGPNGGVGVSASHGRIVGQNPSQGSQFGAHFKINF